MRVYIICGTGLMKQRQCYFVMRRVKKGLTEGETFEFYLEG